VEDVVSRVDLEEEELLSLHPEEPAEPGQEETCRRVFGAVPNGSIRRRLARPAGKVLMAGV
jgi:hypothetical protein